MGEASLYINEHYHTGHLRSASYELNNRSRDVTGLCIDRIGAVDPREPDFLPLKLRLACSPGEIPLKEKDAWSRSEREMLKLLMATHIMKSLIRTERRLEEYLPEKPPFEGYPEAFAYFQFTQKWLNFLLREGQRQMSSPALAVHSFITSWTLRRAIFEGKYLTVKLN